MDREPMFEDDDFCRSLLASSENDGPPDGSCEKLAAALGLPMLPTAPGPSAPAPASPPIPPGADLGAGGSTAVAGAKAALVKSAATVAAGSTTKVAASTGAAALIAKWTAAVVIVSGVAVGGGAALTSSNESRAPSAPASVIAPATVATEVVPPQLPNAVSTVKHGETPPSEPQVDVARGARVESVVGANDGRVARADATENTLPVTKEPRRVEGPAPSEPENNVAAPTKPEGVSTGASPTATSTSTSLTLEVARLDRAKSAVASGQGTVALQELDAYAREFPAGSLRGEATLLRVDALLLAGDRTGAAALARALVQAAPQSPLAPRLRGIAGMANP